MTITSTYGFVLPCRCCGQESFVGPTTNFTEAKTGKQLTAYFAADAKPGDRPVGYSEGTGDTYECKWCHVLKWKQETKPADVV